MNEEGHFFIEIDRLANRKGSSRKTSISSGGSIRRHQETNMAEAWRALKPETLTDQVYEILRERVISGKISWARTLTLTLG